MTYIRYLSDEKKREHAKILANCPHITLYGRCQTEDEYNKLVALGYKLTRHKNKPKRPVRSYNPSAFIASSDDIKRGPPAGFNAMKALLTHSKNVIYGKVLKRKSLTSSGVSVYACLKAFKSISEEVVAWGPVVLNNSVIDAKHVSFITSVQTISEWKCRLSEIWQLRLTDEYKIVPLFVEPTKELLGSLKTQAPVSRRFTFCLHEMRKLYGHPGDCQTAGVSCPYVHKKEDFLVKPVVSLINSLMRTSELRYVLPQAIYDSVTECVENNFEHILTLMKSSRQSRTRILNKLSFDIFNFPTLVRTWATARRYEKAQQVPTDKLVLQFPDDVKEVLPVSTDDVEEFVSHYACRIFLSESSLCAGDRNVVYHKLMNLPRDSTGPISTDPFEGTKLKVRYDSDTTVCPHFHNCTDGCHLSTAVPGTILCGDCLAGVPCRNVVVDTLDCIANNLRKRMMVDDDGFKRINDLTHSEFQKIATQYLLQQCKLVHPKPILPKRSKALELSRQIDLFNETFTEYLKEKGISEVELDDSLNAVVFIPFFTLRDKLHSDLEKQLAREGNQDVALESITTRLNNFTKMLEGVTTELLSFPLTRETLEDSKGFFSRAIARCKADVNSAFEYASNITSSTQEVLDLALSVEQTASCIGRDIWTTQKKITHWTQAKKAYETLSKQFLQFKRLKKALDNGDVPKTFLNFCETVFSSAKKIEDFKKCSELEEYRSDDSDYKASVDYYTDGLKDIVDDYLPSVKKAYIMIKDSMEQEKLRACLQLSKQEKQVKRNGVVLNYNSIMHDLFNVIWTSSSVSEFFDQVAVYTKLLSNFGEDFEEITEVRKKSLGKKAKGQSEQFFRFSSKVKHQPQMKPAPAPTAPTAPAAPAPVLVSSEASDASSEASASEASVASPKEEQ